MWSMVLALFAIGTLVPVLVAIAFTTLLERKLMATLQLRCGPNDVGPSGLLQPVADGVKLLLKEHSSPVSAYGLLYAVAPVFTLTMSLVIWAMLPFGVGISIANPYAGLLLVLAASSLNVHAFVIAGWSSQSTYALLGALRSSAQLIAYELVIGTIAISLMTVSRTLCLGGMFLGQAHCWYFVPLWPVALALLIALLAESNRTPFDLPEAEAELVAGYNVEFSSMPFALFFLSEYSGLLSMSLFSSVLLFGIVIGEEGVGDVIGRGLLVIMGLSGLVCFLTLMAVVGRASYPRYRYDQLMGLGWKGLVPVVLLGLGCSVALARC
nr:NADH dehydrogenase subunit 1 [Rufusia pilicola]